MKAAQYEHLRDKIQNEIDRLEEMENERAKEKDYASATIYFNHRLGLQHAWQIIVRAKSLYGIIYPDSRKTWRNQRRRISR